VHPRALLGVLGVATVVATPAFGAFGAVASQQTHTLSSGTLAAPTALSGACASLPRRVELSWTATTSAFADGYEILRSTTSGGPYASIGTVTGVATTTFTDSTVAALTTYYYVVKAKRNLWRSPASNQATVSTVLCL
jgi:fibronectin type 3 domain-containing protein